MEQLSIRFGNYSLILTSDLFYFMNKFKIEHGTEEKFICTLKFTNQDLTQVSKVYL